MPGIDLSRRFRIIAAAILLLAATTALYHRVSGFSFINFDDDLLIYRNVYVNTGLSLRNLAWAFTSTDKLQWAPITWLSHMIDFQVLGSSPSGHHVVNVLFHLFNTVALLAFLSKTTGSLWRSTFVAALFALHPLHVEPVAWLSARKDVVSTAFFLLTLLAYAWYVKRPTALKFLVTMGAFSASLMSKPMYVTVPVLLLLLDYWPLRRIASADPRGPSSGSGIARRLLLEKIPFFVLAGVFSAVGYVAQSRSDAVTAFRLDRLVLRASTMVVSYGHALCKTVWPARLAIMYPAPGSFSPWVLLASVVPLAAISALVVRCRRTRPFLAVGWLWFLITLFPVSGIVQIGSALSADKFSYIPIVGPFIMVAWGVPEVLESWTSPLRRPVLATAASVILALCAARSWQYLQCWKDSITLYREALAVTEKNFVIMSNLGAAYQARGNFDEAMRYYEESIRAEPRFEMGHANIGYLWLARRDCGRAVPHFIAALQLKPGYKKAEYGLAYCQRASSLNGPH